MPLTEKRFEHQPLAIGKWGNLLMAIIGVSAAYLYHSGALLVDGLYSGVIFLSGIVVARISVAVTRPADRRYPFGYDAQEALYVRFRSLVLLGIPVFAVAGAIGKIITYTTGGDVPGLVFGPILVYAVVMVVICLVLAFWYRRNWLRSGRRSELLRTESRAAVVDAAIKMGRSHLVAAYIKPDASIDGDAVDAIWHTLNESLQHLLGPVKVEVRYGRRSTAPSPKQSTQTSGFG